MKIRTRTFHGALLLLFSTFLLPVANAYQIATPIVSPVPVAAGKPLKLSAKISGPLQNATVSVSVSYGNQIIFSKRYRISEKIGSVYTFSVPSSDPITIPTDPRGQPVQIFIVVLQGKEQYVGEPGGKPFYLIAHCPKIAAVVQPCLYAPETYWARRDAAAKPVRLKKTPPGTP
jgi:hypothetical protein